MPTYPSRLLSACPSVGRLLVSFCTREGPGGSRGPTGRKVGNGRHGVGEVGRVPGERLVPVCRRRDLNVFLEGPSETKELGAFFQDEKVFRIQYVQR